MAFSSGLHPKLEYARTLAATFAYFMLQQRDMMGFASFDDSIRECVLPRWRVGQFRRILAAIPTVASGVGTDLAAALQQTGRLCRTRSLILLVSDLLEDCDNWMPAIRELKAVGHDIRIAQVLDPAELSLDFGETAFWHDLENETRLHINPDRERSAYLRRFGQHQQRLQAQLRALGIPMRSLTTDMPLDIALRELITARTATALAPSSAEAAP